MCQADSNNNLAKWIWISQKDYPDCQKTIYSALLNNKEQFPYIVAELRKTFSLRDFENIKDATLRVSGDTAYILSFNKKQIQRGPCATGGDFLFNDEPRPNFYTYCTDALANIRDAVKNEKSKDTLTCTALVRMKPSVICEYSKGHGGFYMDLVLTYHNGTKEHLTTDGTWQGRLLPAYCTPDSFDNHISPRPFTFCDEIEDIWHTKDADILPCDEHVVMTKTIIVKAHESLSLTDNLDMIEACYTHASIKTNSPISCVIHYFETDEEGIGVTLKTDKDCFYHNFELMSVGGIKLDIQNTGDTDADICLWLNASHYPILQQAKTETSDKELNQVIATCTNTLKICRQSLHLDSPKHCEPLACTGDYYVETMMTAASFGDMSLAVMDVERTAELLRHHDGRMFHTTYSLIWVQMLYDVYRFTGKKAILHKNEDALCLLLHRFETYIGETGLIETPPDYMFVDWIYPAGINMHHPPKCLGQTVLNLFYYGALQTASKIEKELGNNKKSKEYLSCAKILKDAVITHLWDEKQQLFTEGLTTPTPEHLLGDWMPKNLNHVYYLKQSNILATYFGFFNKKQCRQLLVRILDGNNCIFATEKVQPYFMHFLLEAIYRNGLRDTYTLRELNRWKSPIEECHKGLVEGFYPPEQGYHFDHSHAWGGTPVWSLTQALTGLKILKPGYKAISLNPSLLGLEYANVEIPTPFGMIEVKLKNGEAPQISVPKGISISVQKLVKK